MSVLSRDQIQKGRLSNTKQNVSQQFKIHYRWLLFCAIKKKRLYDQKSLFLHNIL